MLGIVLKYECTTCFGIIQEGWHDKINSLIGVQRTDAQYYRAVFFQILWFKVTFLKNIDIIPNYFEALGYHITSAFNISHQTSFILEVYVYQLSF